MLPGLSVTCRMAAIMLAGFWGKGQWEEPVVKGAGEEESTIIGQKQESFPRGKLCTNFKCRTKQSVGKRKDGDFPEDKAFADLEGKLTRKRQRETDRILTTQTTQSGPTPQYSKIFKKFMCTLLFPDRV